jgi:DHA2 family multidrug resistance protein
VPIGIAAGFLCARYLPSPRALARRMEAVDWRGIAFLVIGIASLQILLETGHKNDWFDSDWITALAVTAVTAIVLFVWHELTTEHPVVDLRVLKHRALIVGCVYGVAMGIGLYGSVFLFPIFTQQVLRWNSWQSGMAILPSSIATAFTMPIAGRLVWRLGPAPLFAIGAAVFLPSLWGMSHWTAQSGWWDLFWPQIGRGVSMGMMFSPLSVATLRALPPRDVLQGSGLYNLFRQTGGSLGIALLATMLDHRGAVHYAHLAESVTPLSDATQQRMAQITAGLVGRGLAASDAAGGAVAMLSNTIHAQAAVLAFRDCYLMVFTVFLMLVPLIPLLKRPESIAR